MDTNRLKLKIGPHEFEAEGPPEVVKAQLEAFTTLVSMLANNQPAPASLPAETKPEIPAPIVEEEAPPPKVPNHEGVDAKLYRIMKHDDRVVSLTVRASNVDEAVLLLLLGQKVYRDNDSVTGYEVMQGLAITGQRVARVDRVLEKAAKDGHVIVIGEHRGKRYRLTNTGIAKARQLAGDLVAIVA